VSNEEILRRLRLTTLEKRKWDTIDVFVMTTGKENTSNQHFFEKVHHQVVCEVMKKHQINLFDLSKYLKGVLLILISYML